MSVVEKLDAVVIGAGVVGLAIARSLAIAGKEVLIVEKAKEIGSETSSRNSEVVHAGLYYPQNSLKGRFCVQGRRMMYDYCRERQVDCRKIGKLVVAANDEQLRETLPLLQRQAALNGANDLRIISKEEAKDIEPNVECVGALWSPSTGLVDSHNFMIQLLADAESEGAMLALNSSLTDARVVNDTVELCVDGVWVGCRTLVNSAGLWAHRIAEMIHRNHQWKPPKQYFAKGNYFRLIGKSPFSHLVYPVPDKRGGLGVHATVDGQGYLRFGPDVSWFTVDTNPDDLDYLVESDRLQQFYSSIRTYWPGLPDDSLSEDYCGIRPKLSHPDFGNVAFQDFRIDFEDSHKIQGLVHLFGIESPGLTSSIAIADFVASRLNV